MVAFAEAVLATERLVLIPLRADDAAELAPVLADVRLHEFIGGRPDTPAELAERYARWAAGSPRPEEIWLNWIVRRQSDNQPVGTVQATVTRARAGSVASDPSAAGWVAEVAWVIAVPWQGQGFASEAARALVDWLRAEGVSTVSASIHPEHHASAAVAQRVGLALTDEVVDGERVWRSP